MLATRPVGRGPGPPTLAVGGSRQNGVAAGDKGGFWADAGDMWLPNRHEIRQATVDLLTAFELGTSDEAYFPPPVRAIPDGVLFEIETKGICQTAVERYCAIVRHAGFHLLQGEPRLANVFVHTPLEFRVRRVADVFRSGGGCGLRDFASARAVRRPSHHRAGSFGTTRCRSFSDAPSVGRTLAVSSGARYVPAPLVTA